MREIKIKVWDCENKKWVNPKNVLMSADGDISFNGDFDIFKKHPNMRGIKVLFTGLHDKNDTEIYEGDILSDYTETDEGVVKSFQQVYWCKKKGAWMLDESYHQNKSEGRLLSKNLEQFEYEISGNIYKNPELINS